MSIIDMIADHKSRMVFHKDKDEATELFMQQKLAIDGIKNKAGFKEIRSYRERTVVNCNDRLRTIKTEDIKYLQGELNAAMDFLNFLDNLQEDLDKEDLNALK